MAAGADTVTEVRPLRGAGGRANLGDRFYRGFTGAFALAALLALVGIFLQLAFESIPSFEVFHLKFLVTSRWDPVNDQFGALPFIWGTLYSSVLALLLAVPVSLATAAFLSEVSPPWLRAPVSFLVELLAAVPSVVYGLWGLLVLVPWLHDAVEVPLQKRLGFLPFFSGDALGVGMLPAAVVLAIMIIPIITAVTRDVLRVVPREQREGSLALGATPWETIRGVVFPYGQAGIIGAVILGWGRALGETMAVTMVIGNTPNVSLSVINPAYTLASVLANEFSEASGHLHVAALLEIGFLLLLLTILVNGMARWLVWRVRRSGGSR